SSLRDSLEENFQTLIFDVNNLPLAVPLIKLGGIVNISNQDITPLVGTPDWFLGLVPNERGNLMVVDTQKFIMPERPVENENSYDYLIVLDNSQWALACHSVGDAKNMHASDIRWSSKLSKRPWFAGMVVEYMSALIEVDSLINQLAEQIVE
ncbi:MAG: chemotaxis protein CheW, partial [Kangiellaceae bacterium]